MTIHVEELFHAVADLSAAARDEYFEHNHVDERLRGEVEALLAFDSSSKSSLTNDIGRVALTALERTQTADRLCGPYRLERLLGRGGMGNVYAAQRVDGEVTQRVAVKLLRPGSDEPHVRRRFLSERQILASLSHPNVARLVDAGHREDGQPYLAMEYIEGKPIDIYAETLNTREKVRLFIKTCAAVSYLHRNLVVHRDLKPTNILVTPDGEPKLLDFGIAKLVDLRGDSTLTSVPMLTPDYASPEQATGGPMTTATDIYSLGALLYKLLTGQSPHQFEGDAPGAIALAISAGRVTPPSKLVPALKGDFEIVIMKALRKEPQERYASVDAFADDLRACLAKRPVQARSGDVWYRTRRFLRRHWFSAVASTVVVASLATGMCIANRQRAIAERRFAQLRQLSNRVLDLDGEMRMLPGSVEARHHLVGASLEYLEGLAREAQGNRQLAQEIADGYWRLARIQGVNAEFNLGDSAKAEESLKKANALVESMLASKPDDRNALFRSALIAHDRMIVASEERRSEVLVYARRAEERLEKFLRLSATGEPVRLEGFLRPGDVREAELRGAANLYMNIALMYVNAHLYEEGARRARRAAELSRPFASARDITAGGLSILANALRYQGDLEGALATIREARTISEQAVYPHETARMFNQYGPLLREGRILGERDAINLDRPEEAAQVLQKALDLVDGPARKDPNDYASRGRVGTVSRELGDILRDRYPRRALAVYELGIHRLEETPTSVVARRERAELLAKSAYALRHLHRTREAQLRIDTAFDILKNTKDYPTNRITLGSPVYSVVRARADQEADTGKTASAIQSYEEVLRGAAATGAKPETNLQDAVRVSQIFAALAELNRRAGKNGDAEAVQSRRVELWRAWDCRLPGNTFVRRQLEAAGQPAL